MRSQMLQRAACAMLAAGLASVNAFLNHRLVLPPPFEDLRASHLIRSIGGDVFDQLIDHSNPSLGTFKQRYWWSDEFYIGDGSPVVFTTPGETSGDGYVAYMSNLTITGTFAQALGAACVVLEHRYWGTSSPYDVLSTKNLQYLTLENSLKDFTYFANNVKLPFDTNGTSHPSKAPWVFSGGSYSGALAAWTNVKDPGTFWAYHASSAVVEAIGDYWNYFVPVQKGMAMNCSADVTAVVEHVDTVLLNGSDAEKQALKATFGLEAIEHDDDFAAVLAWGPFTWQAHEFVTGYAPFFEFCDYVENQWPNSGNPEPDAHGVGLDKALTGYAKWVKEKLIPTRCSAYGYWEDGSLDCFNTYNETSPMYSDRSLANNADRQWQWMLCNEPFGFRQTGAPQGVSTIVSRLVNRAYKDRQCALYFPSEDGFTYGSAKGRTPDDVNQFTGGWFTNTTRLIWSNGEFDPWVEATVSSSSRPGGPLQSTLPAPVYVIPQGIHCSDYLIPNGWFNDGVMEVINAEVATIKAWVEEFNHQIY